MVSARAMMAAALVAAVGLSVAACREEEMDKPITLEKGHYQGPKEPPLSEATLDEIRQRQMRQNYSGS